MLNPGLYIHGAGFMAPQASAEEAVVRLSAREPDYSGLIPPMQLRRMSKAVRMGIGAAKSCLDAAGAARPDAIAVGTALGCLQDTETFLGKMVGQDERMLTPTAFIQSTHNTVAGQIALVTGCHGYNTTISQRGHSFEGAVLSASLYLGEEPEHSVLCGGVDELTDVSLALNQRVDVYTKEATTWRNLQEAGNGMPIAGEGAGFLLLRRRPEGAAARISGLELFTERETDLVLGRLRQSISYREGDLLLLGDSGDARQRPVYEALRAEWAGTLQVFKDRTGDWGTAVAPAICRTVLEWPEGAARIWIVNHYGRDWSVWLLERG